MVLHFTNENGETNAGFSLHEELPSAEMVDVMVSKTVIGLDPNKHSTVTFKMPLFSRR